VNNENIRLPRVGNSTTSEATAIMALMQHEKVHLKINDYIMSNTNGYPLKKPKNYQRSFSSVGHPLPQY
jgi:hypothetical protein